MEKPPVAFWFVVHFPPFPRSENSAYFIACPYCNSPPIIVKSLSSSFAMQSRPSGYLLNTIVEYT